MANSTKDEVKKTKPADKQFKRGKSRIYKPQSTEKDVLRIIDLRVNYEVTYLIEYDQDFVKAAKDIFSQKIVGFDGEYRMGQLNKETHNLPSYI